VGSDGYFVDGKYWIRIYNNNLRFLNNVPRNANVVNFADLGRLTSSSGATCFWANSAFAYKATSLEIKIQNQKQ
jgi:hypothetical protein